MRSFLAALFLVVSLAIVGCGSTSETDTNSRADTSESPAPEGQKDGEPNPQELAGNLQIVYDTLTNYARNNGNLFPRGVTGATNSLTALGLNLQDQGAGDGKIRIEFYKDESISDLNALATCISDSDSAVMVVRISSGQDGRNLNATTVTSTASSGLSYDPDVQELQGAPSVAGTCRTDVASLPEVVVSQEGSLG